MKSGSVSRRLNVTRSFALASVGAALVVIVGFVTTQPARDWRRSPPESSPLSQRVVLPAHHDGPSPVPGREEILGEPARVDTQPSARDRARRIPDTVVARTWEGPIGIQVTTAGLMAGRRSVGSDPPSRGSLHEERESESTGEICHGTPEVGCGAPQPSSRGNAVDVDPAVHSTDGAASCAARACRGCSGRPEGGFDVHRVHRGQQRLA